MRTADRRERRIWAGILAGLSFAFSTPTLAAECPELRITKDVFASSVTDLAAALRKSVGPSTRPAEWNEIRVCFEKYGLSYFHKLGAVKTDPTNTANPPNSQILVLVNGERYFQAPNRAYFAAFHEGALPPNWLAHDQIGGNQIVLGSWSYLLPAFYVTNAPIKSGPAVSSLAPDVGRCTGARNPDEVIAACTSIISTGSVADPILAQVYKSRALAWHNKGQFDRAISDYDQAVTLASADTDAINNRGKAWQAKGNLDRAIADFSDAIRIDPADRVGALRFRSIALRQRGDIEGAIADADKAIRLYPDYNAAYVARGLAFEAKGDTGRARADYSVALALPAKYPSGQDAQRQARERMAALDQATPRASPQPSVSSSQSISGGGDFKHRVALVIGNSNYQFANQITESDQQLG